MGLLTGLQAVAVQEALQALMDVAPIAEMRLMTRNGYHCFVMANPDGVDILLDGVVERYASLSDFCKSYGLKS